MSHFEICDWVDFVRGISDTARAAAMSAHLATGCQECVSTHRWLEEVAAAAGSSASVKVPEALVRRAERIFEQTPAFRFNTLFPLMAHLVFDAGRSVQPVGIRSSAPIQHALYEAGEFTIDVRQESSRGSALISLVGQISKEGPFHEDGSRLPVALFSGPTMIANTLSNRFGEFILTYPRRPDLKLFIAIVNTGRKIEIPLIRAARRTDYRN